MKKTREDKICDNCHLHTVQKLVKDKWVCVECGVVQKKEE
jgi:ribosomal protein L37AE/L43A